MTPLRELLNAIDYHRPEMRTPLPAGLEGAINRARKSKDTDDVHHLIPGESSMLVIDDGPEVTDEMVDAGSRILWQDRDARHGGPWDDRNPNEVCVVQTRATMHVALVAALSTSQSRPVQKNPPVHKDDAPVRPNLLRDALHAARVEAIVAITFLRRDRGTDRLGNTVLELIKRMEVLDRAIITALENDR